MVDFNKALAENKVFDCWRKRQREPERCKFTNARKKLVRSALKDYTAEDLCLFIQYAYEAETAEAQYWRGENEDGRTYLDLSNLLVKKKLDGRVEAARAWINNVKEVSTEESESITKKDIMTELCRRGPSFAQDEESAKEVISRPCRAKKMKREPRW